MTSDKAKENNQKLREQKLKALEATLGKIEKSYGKKGQKAHLGGRLRKLLPAAG